jgi:hypothetical protein
MANISSTVGFAHRCLHRCTLLLPFLFDHVCPLQEEVLQMPLAPPNQTWMRRQYGNHTIECGVVVNCSSVRRADGKCLQPQGVCHLMLSLWLLAASQSMERHAAGQHRTPGDGSYAVPQEKTSPQCTTRIVWLSRGRRIRRDRMERCQAAPSIAAVEWMLGAAVQPYERRASGQIGSTPCHGCSHLLPRVPLRAPRVAPYPVVASRPLSNHGGRHA